MTFADGTWGTDAQEISYHAVYPDEGLWLEWDLQDIQQEMILINFTNYPIIILTI